MADHATVSRQTSNARRGIRTHLLRSHSRKAKPSLTLRTLSLSTREKPATLSADSETPKSSRPKGERHEQRLKNQDKDLRQDVFNVDEIGWLALVAGLLLSCVLFAWACLLYMSANKNKN